MPDKLLRHLSGQSDRPGTPPLDPFTQRSLQFTTTLRLPLALPAVLVPVLAALKESAGTGQQALDAGIVRRQIKRHGEVSGINAGHGPQGMCAFYDNHIKKT